MAALPAGVQYGLSSESTYKENKELVYVKLTDSALRAIQDYVINNRDKLAKPKIQFLPGNEGKIVIPVSSNGNELCDATFSFSISSNAEVEGPQGSFDCVRSGGARRLESCGPLSRRMRVQANDDSYEATKDRMARTVAAEQSKCTRVIKPNQTDIGRRVKVRSSQTLYPSAATQLAERAERAERPDHRLDHRPERPERPEHRPEHRPERLDHRSDRPPVSVPRPQPPQPTQPQPQHTQPHQQPHPHQPQRPPPNPDLTRRSIKERLIQLLALKPFKKPELYARLNSEGIKEKEKGLVNKILPQIGTLKDNCYHLRRAIWNDVNEDWPFYSEEEKRILKRRKPQNLTPPLSSDSANSLSPRASPGGSKRTTAGVAEEPPASKKQRISHYRRPSPPSSGYATASSGASSGERHASDNEDDRTVKKDNGYTLSFNTVKEICPSPVKTNGFSRSSPPLEQSSNNNAVSDKHITNMAVVVPLENPEPLVPDDNVDDMEEIEREYPAISSGSTRRSYKKKFTELYAEYREQYERVARVAALFTRLEQQLHRAQPHSPDHHSIEQRIVDEYRRRRHDADYQRARRRLHYLHRKLAHIKRMVNAYDQLRNLKPERVSTPSTTQAY